MEKKPNGCLCGRPLARTSRLRQACDGPDGRLLEGSPSVPITIDPDLGRRGVGIGLGWLEGEFAGEPDVGGIAAQLAAAAVRAVGQAPAIAATRRAIKALGKDPSRYRPSAEALRRRLTRGQGPPRIAPLVDLGTLLSLEGGVSIGVYDRERLVPPTVLRVGGPGERYLGVDGQPLELAGLPLLADALGPFGSPVRDSARSRLEPASRRILVVLYGFAPVPVEAEELARAVDRFRVLGGLAVTATGLVRGP